MEGGKKIPVIRILDPFRRILHLRSLRLGEGGGKQQGGGKKVGADQRYKRNGTPRIEWPFGLMPNYFLPVKRKKGGGGGESEEFKETTTFRGTLV